MPVNIAPNSPLCDGSTLGPFLESVSGFRICVLSSLRNKLPSEGPGDVATPRTTLDTLIVVAFPAGSSHCIFMYPRNCMSLVHFFH